MMFILLFFILLSALILIHEAGHYFVARAFGIKAEEFGFGFPPRIVGCVRDRGKWKIIGPRDRTQYACTIWSLNWLPLGGFVRIKGEHADGISDVDSIHTKPIWQRICVMSAGVIMNWLLAIVLFTSIFLIGTPAFLDAVPKDARVSRRAIVISETLPQSPAARAGIEPGDELTSIQGVAVASADEAKTLIRKQDDRPLSLRVRRNNQAITVDVTPVLLKDINRFGIGVAMADIGIISLPFPSALAHGVTVTASLSKDIVLSLVGIVRNLVTRGTVTEDVSGPVGIAVIANRIAKQGIAPLLQFTALLSINLAVINFLPIPALDGGRILFLVIEKLRRRPMSRTLEIGIHNIAFILLILIILFVTARDLTRYGGTIVGGVKGAIGL